MALTINSIPKDATANSYISLADANYFFSTKYKSADAWSVLSNDQKSQLLLTACRQLETYIYGGAKTTQEQALQWPRMYLINREGYQVNTQTIPKQMEYAQCEMADWILSEEDRMLTDIDLQQVDQFKAGPLDIKVAVNAVVVPPIVKQLISSISHDALVTTDNTANKSVSMVR